MSDSAVGILSGTFDPVHLGHIKISHEAMRQLGLSEILLIPTSYSFGKLSDNMTSIKHRREMLRRAIADQPFLTLSTLHITQENTDTGWEMIQAYADHQGYGQIYLLMGCDTLNRLSRWDQPHRAIEMSRIVFIPRRGCKLPNLKRLQVSLPGIAENITILDMIPVDISSSEIRWRVSQGMSITKLVSKNVADYIYQHGLYQDKTSVREL